MPKFKIRNEGGRVYFTDQIVIESKIISGQNLHPSSSCFNSSDPQPHLNEANLSPDARGWKLLIFARYSGKNMVQGAVRINQAVRLFHTEAGGFVSASGDSHKHLKSADKRHAPYLKPVPFGDPLVPLSHSAKQVFVFERAKRSKPGKGYVIWGKDEAYRIKHLASRKYLAFAAKQPDHKNMLTSKSFMDEEFLLDLVDDDELDQAQAHRTYFYIVPTKSEESDSPELLEVGEVMRIEHRLQTPAGVVSLWLHRGNEKQKGAAPKLQSRFAQESKLDVEQVLASATSSSLQLLLSRRKHDEDAFSLHACHAEEQRDIETVRSMVKVCKTYILRIQHQFDSTNPEKITSQQAEEMKHCLLTAIHFASICVDEEDDGSAEVDHSAIYEAALELDGPGKPHQQRMAADLKLINAIFDVVQEWINQADQKLEWDNPARYQIAKLAQPKNRDCFLIHKLCFHSLTRIFHQNHHNQLYFARQKLDIPKRTKKGQQPQESSIKLPGQEGYQFGDMSKGFAKKLTHKSSSGTDKFEQGTFISATIRQINAGTIVGATDCLLELISDNEELLQKNVDLHTLHEFVNLIDDKGPKHQVVSLSIANSADKSSLYSIRLSVHGFLHCYFILRRPACCEQPRRCAAYAIPRQRKKESLLCLNSYI
jgi:hypothetical protein